MIEDNQRELDSEAAELNLVLYLWTKFIWQKFVGMTDDNWSVWMTKATGNNFIKERPKDE